MKKNKTSMLKAECKSTLLFFLFMLVSVCANAEILKSIIIDDLKYSLDTSTHKATVTGKAQEAKSPYHLVIPETVTYEEESYVVTEIGRSSNLTFGLFSNNYITGITFPNTLEVIGPSALTGCSRLSGDLVIPNSVRRIEHSAFSKCSSTANLILGNSLEYIGSYAFQYCKFTGSLIIPKSVTYIDVCAFHYCCFTGPLVIPDSVVYLGDSAFRCMEGISGYLYIGKSVTNIGVSCFSDGTCSHLDSIIIYGSNLNIRNSSAFFSNGSDCRFIYLSNQVKSINRNIFASIYYKNIKEVISDNPTPPTFTSDGNNTGSGFYGTVKDNAVLKVPAGSMQAYKSATYWKDFKNIQEFTHDPTEISLNTSELSLFVNDSFTLSTKIIPFYADNHSIKWTSSNEAVAEVDENGKITAKSVGEAQITATTNNNLSVTCFVSVKPILAIGITLNLQNVTLSPGETKILIATVSPDNVTNGSVIWASENENVATVDSEGCITAISVGDTKITASATDDSGVYAECAVVVSELDGIEDIIADKSVYVRIFNLNGVLVYEGVYSDAKLLPDYYIIVCDGKNIKVKVK